MVCAKLGAGSLLCSSRSRAEATLPSVDASATGGAVAAVGAGGAMDAVGAGGAADTGGREFLTCSISIYSSLCEFLACYTSFYSC